MKEIINEHSIVDSSHAPGLQSPMPGVIVQVYVQEGQTVAIGDRLLAIEAMKMEHTIRAPSAGVVQKLYFKVGDLVNVGATLVEFTANE
jgi:3-methylcrotonyl-CoA carboxylase alpha subunit